MIILFFTCAAMVPVLMAHIGDFDEVWRKRLLEAQNHALNTYEYDPFNVTLAFNNEVHKYVCFFIYYLLPLFKGVH